MFRLQNWTPAEAQLDANGYLLHHGKPLVLLEKGMWICHKRGCPATVDRVAHDYPKSCRDEETGSVFLDR